MTVSGGFSTSTYGRMISAGYLRTKLTIIVQVGNVPQRADVLIINGLFPAVGGWIGRRVELATVVVVICLISIDGHIIDVGHWITGAPSLPLLP